MNLDRREIARYMRMGGAAPEGDLLHRVETLAAEAPIVPRSVWAREGDRVFLCGTIGAAFDDWQRKLSLFSSVDALIAQAIGTAAIERVMDDLEAAIRPTLGEGESLLPRRSPGYGEMPLSLSREILDRLEAPHKIGVTLTDSLLLLPSKSVTAICEVQK